MNRGFLDETEKKYVRELLKLQKERKPFTHRAMVDAMGWRSLNSSWAMMQKLLDLGVLEQGRRPVVVECPVVARSAHRLLNQRPPSKRAA